VLKVLINGEGLSWNNGISSAVTSVMNSVHGFRVSAVKAVILPAFRLHDLILANGDWSGPVSAISLHGLKLKVGRSDFIAFALLPRSVLGIRWRDEESGCIILVYSLLGLKLIVGWSYFFILTAITEMGWNVRWGKLTNRLMLTMGSKLLLLAIYVDRYHQVIFSWGLLVIPSNTCTMTWYPDMAINKWRVVAEEVVWGPLQVSKNTWKKGDNGYYFFQIYLEMVGRRAKGDGD
jgi:hypothetical protein